MRGASCGKRPRSSSPGLGRGSLGEDIEREALCRRRGSNGVGKHAIRGLLKITPVALRSHVYGFEGIAIGSGVRRSGPGPSKRWNEGVFAQLCLRDEFEIDETASFFFPVRNEAWSRRNRMVAHQSGSWHWRDCNPGPAEAIRGEACDGVGVVFVVRRVLSLALSPDLRGHVVLGTE